MNQSQHYRGIDVLRGLAASLVLAYHVVELGAWKTFPIDNPLALLVRTGWIGVDLFLVISGFVIGRAAIVAAQAPQQLGWRRTFMERRLRRIVPLYLLTCAVCLFTINQAVFQHGWRVAVINITTHLGFVHNLNPHTMSSINGPNWSVALEMQFYVLLVLVAPWLGTKRAWPLLVAFLGTGLLWRWLGTELHTPGTANPYFQFHFNSQLPGTLDQFACGIAAAKLATSPRFRPGWLACATASGCALLLLTLAWNVFWRNATYWDSPAMIVFWRTLVSSGFAAVLLALVLCPKPMPTPLRPASYLGDISYGIYLWHLVVLSLLIRHTQVREWGLLVATFAITIVLAALSWHWLEKPIIHATKPSWWARNPTQMPFLGRLRSWQ